MRNQIIYSLYFSVTIIAITLHPALSYAQSGGETAGIRYKAVGGWMTVEYAAAKFYIEK